MRRSSTAGRAPRQHELGDERRGAWRLGAAPRRPCPGAEPGDGRDPDGCTLFGRADRLSGRGGRPRAGMRTAPGTRSGSARPCMSTGGSRRLPGLWRPDRGRRARRASRRRDSRLPLPRARRALVGRHRLHLKHDASLPVGGAHRRWLAGRTPGATIPAAKLSDSRKRGGTTGSPPTGGRARATRTRRSSTRSASRARSGRSPRAVSARAGEGTRTLDPAITNRRCSTS